LLKQGIEKKRKMHSSTLLCLLTLATATFLFATDPVGKLEDEDHLNTDNFVQEYDGVDLLTHNMLDMFDLTPDGQEHLQNIVHMLLATHVLRQNALAQATLLYQLDWRLTALLVLDSLESTVQTVKLIDQVIELRHRAWQAIDVPLVRRMFSSTSNPIFLSRLPGVFNASLEHFTSSTEIGRLGVLSFLSPSPNDELQVACCLLRSLMLLASCSLLEPPTLAVHALKEFVRFSDLHENFSMSPAYAILGVWSFARHSDHGGTFRGFGPLDLLTHLSFGMQEDLKLAAVVVSEHIGHEGMTRAFMNDVDRLPAVMRWRALKSVVYGQLMNSKFHSKDSIIQDPLIGNARNFMLGFVEGPEAFSTFSDSSRSLLSVFRTCCLVQSDDKHVDNRSDLQKAEKMQVNSGSKSGMPSWQLENPVISDFCAFDPTVSDVESFYLQVNRNESDRQWFDAIGYRLLTMSSQRTKETFHTLTVSLFCGSLEDYARGFLRDIHDFGPFFQTKDLGKTLQAVQPFLDGLPGQSLIRRYIEGAPSIKELHRRLHVILRGISVSVLMTHLRDTELDKKRPPALDEMIGMYRATNPQPWPDYLPNVPLLRNLSNMDTRRSLLNYLTRQAWSSTTQPLAQAQLCVAFRGLHLFLDQQTIAADYADFYALAQKINPHCSHFLNNCEEEVSLLWQHKLVINLLSWIGSVHTDPSSYTRLFSSPQNSEGPILTGCRFSASSIVDTYSYFVDNVLSAYISQSLSPQSFSSFESSSLYLQEQALWVLFLDDIIVQEAGIGENNSLMIGWVDVIFPRVMPSPRRLHDLLFARSDAEAEGSNCSLLLASLAEHVSVLSCTQALPELRVQLLHRLYHRHLRVDELKIPSRFVTKPLLLAALDHVSSTPKSVVPTPQEARDVALFLKMYPRLPKRLICSLREPLLWDLAQRIFYSTWSSLSEPDFAFSQAFGNWLAQLKFADFGDFIRSNRGSLIVCTVQLTSASVFLVPLRHPRVGLRMTAIFGDLAIFYTPSGLMAMERGDQLLMRKLLHVQKSLDSEVVLAGMCQTPPLMCTYFLAKARLGRALLFGSTAFHGQEEESQAPNAKDTAQMPVQRKAEVSNDGKSRTPSASKLGPDWWLQRALQRILGDESCGGPSMHASILLQDLGIVWDQEQPLSTSGHWRPYFSAQLDYLKSVGDLLRCLKDHKDLMQKLGDHVAQLGSLDRHSTMSLQPLWLRIIMRSEALRRAVRPILAARLHALSLRPLEDHRQQ
jgi:hypothetical protein